jgi:hypothetical protein
MEKSAYIPQGFGEESMKETHFTTTSSATIEFGEKDRGKAVGFSGRYENNWGGKGAFGKIIVVYIP